MQHIIEQIEDNRKFMQDRLAKLQREIGNITMWIAAVEVKQGEFRGDTDISW